MKKKFPGGLKLADVSPIHKKLQKVAKGNYRPVSVLAVVSKVFERIIDKQTNNYMEKYLSRYICGYRAVHCPETALLVMMERWKESRDKGGYAGGVLMDLSKAFDTLDHKLLIAKLRMALIWIRLRYCLIISVIYVRCFCYFPRRCNSIHCSFSDNYFPLRRKEFKFVFQINVFDNLSS